MGCGTCVVQNLNVLQRVAQKMARRNSGVISRNSGVISRNSGVISRNSGVFFWTESSAGFDFEKFFTEEF